MRTYLSNIREETQCTQEQAAKAMGIVQGYYNAIEQGVKQKVMDMKTLLSIAKAFNKTPEEIFALEMQYMHQK
jgi:Predicted transcriptional regulators